jgi:stress response protein SCP2
LIVCALTLKDSKWQLKRVATNTNGNTFDDCKDTLREEADLFNDAIVIEERVLRKDKIFMMKKGDGARLPTGTNSIIIGLGWTCEFDFDMDASVVALDKDKKVADMIWYNKLEGSGMRHRGDNLTGKGEGDDERIRINLLEVPETIMELYFTVNIYSGCSTFRHVYNSYVRICLADPEKTNKSFAVSTVYARYPLD